jgi:hypothetical protein
MAIIRHTPFWLSPAGPVGLCATNLETQVTPGYWCSGPLRAVTTSRKTAPRPPDPKQRDSLLQRRLGSGWRSTHEFPFVLGGWASYPTGAG